MAWWWYNVMVCVKTREEALHSQEARCSAASLVNGTVRVQWATQAQIYIGGR